MSSALPFYGNRTPEQLKVSELREELKRRGIQCKGLKKELVERLDDAIQKELQEQRNALLTAKAPPEVEATAEPDPESEPVVELKPVDPSPVLQPLPPVYDEPTDPPSQITDVQGQGTSPPDLNLAPKEAHFESKEPVLGPKQAFQSIESESETVEHAVEPETVPDSTPKVNSVPSPYPGGIEVSLHESLSEVPEVANSDANAEQTAKAEVKIGLEEDHVPEVKGEPNVVEDHVMEEPKHIEDHVMEEPVVEKVDDAAIGLVDEELNPTTAEAVEPALESAEEVKVVEVVVTTVEEDVQIKEVNTVEYKVEEVASEATGEGLHPEATGPTSEVSSHENGEAWMGDLSKVTNVVEKPAADSEVEVKEVDVKIETVEVVVRTVDTRTEEQTGDLIETETVETVIQKVEIDAETVLEDVEGKVELHSADNNLAAATTADKDEHMTDIEQVAVTDGPVETAVALDNVSGLDVAVPMESLLPGVIPVELTLGKAGSESDELRDLEERRGQVANKVVSKEERPVEAEKPKYDERRHDRGSRREPIGRSDERSRYDKEQRREPGATHAKTDDDRHRYEKDRRYGSGRRDDDKVRYDDVRREPMGINQKIDDERQRARRRESSRPELRHSKQTHRERDETLEDRTRVYASSELQRSKGEVTNADDNGKGKDIRPMEIDSDTLAGSKRKEEDTEARQLEPTKRQRRWNSGKSLTEKDTKLTEASKEVAPPEVRDSSVPSLSTTSTGGIPGSTTPKASANAERVPTSKSLQPVSKADATVNGESSKQRVVPPSTRATTTSLKIDRFLRPFTFKAVKDLLSQTGTIKDIWMDHIKTHCYITYSSVEEAIATREAVYNLQWPPHGGKLLIAEFVEPEEVKLRSEGSSEKSALTPATTPRGSTANSTPGGALGPPSSTNPPPVTAPATAATPGPPARDKPNQPPKRDPEPVPTLDDLFKKTRAKPHIYYLPLTEEQVTGKISAASKQPISKPSVRV